VSTEAGPSHFDVIGADVGVSEAAGETGETVDEDGILVAGRLEATDRQS